VTNPRKASRLKIRLIPSVAIATFFIGAFGAAIATASAPVTQGYNTGEAIPIGSIVGLQKDSRDTIVASSTTSVDTILGVVVNQDSSPLVISGGANQVQVATNGPVSVLVSDINGPIAQGDQITASPIKGIGMRATVNTKVVGVAQGGMSGTTKQTVKDEAGKDREITIGEAPVLVSVSYHYQQPEKTVIPQAFQNIANSVAGKRVDSLPIIISGVIFIIMLITVSSIVYAMIRSSIVSVGRNPMAQSAVFRGIIQLSILVIAIIGVSIIAIYLILTRL